MFSQYLHDSVGASRYKTGSIGGMRIWNRPAFLAVSQISTMEILLWITIAMECHYVYVQRNTSILRHKKLCAGLQSISRNSERLQHFFNRETCLVLS
jgi:hypothetical protein